MRLKILQAGDPVLRQAARALTETDIASGTLTGSLSPTTNTDNQSGKFIYGYSAGLGLDVALTRNVFLRTEYEYVQFFGLGGTHLYLNTARVGGGLKF